MGRRNSSSTSSSSSSTIDLDLRDGAMVAIPTGMHAGAVGVVDGRDREGHPRCRFQLRLNNKKPGSAKAPMAMVVGTWWMQAAVEASVAQLPVVNVPPAAETEDAATKELRALCASY